MPLKARLWKLIPSFITKPKPREAVAGSFKRNAKGFSFGKLRRWVYADLKPITKNILPTMHRESPHLILYDSSSGKPVPRFVLEHRRIENRKTLVIETVQRTRTEYKQIDGEWTWLPEKETQTNKEFQQRLCGIHPADFLVAEFILRNKKKILRDLKKGNAGVMLKSYFVLRYRQHYNEIISRFFEAELVNTSEGKFHRLDLNKRWVRQILNLEKDSRGNILDDKGKIIRKTEK